MPFITMEISGIEEATARFTEWAASSPGRVEEAVRAGTLDAYGAAEPLVPVLTGFLLSRLRTRFGGNQSNFWGELYDDAPYALPVCMGHHTRSGSWVPAQDFMTLPYLVGSKTVMSHLGGIFV